MKKIFQNKNITWKFIILFSIIIALITAIINRIPILDDTSFQDIAVIFDLWILFALYIILNCKNVKDAILKTFVFFLISQPLIYLIEALIDTIINNKSFIDTSIFYIKYYYIGAKWLHWTILVIPGSFIAYQLKKDNILSALILSVATMYYTYAGIYNFFIRYHYISGIFCIVMAFLLIFIILSKKKERIVAITLTVISLLLSMFMYYKTINTPMPSNDIIYIDSEIVNVLVEDENIVTAYIEDNSVMVDSSTKVGNTKIIITDKENNKYIYNVESSYKGLKIEEK